MSEADRAYLTLSQDILDNGNDKSDRTGTGTLSLFSKKLRFDLRLGFPILTTKEVHFKSVVTELLWFLRGDTNTQYLKDHGCRIWKAWETPKGEIGPMYGKQWRAWRDTYDATKTIDQIAVLIETLKNNPDSRRMVVSAWNVSDLPLEKYSPQKNAHWGRMALAPCHYSFQCYVNDGILSMEVNQRSADIFLGVPFNIASYALLMHMLAQVTGLTVGLLHWNGGDCHIYKNHIDQVQEQLRRYKDNEEHSAPILTLNPNVMNIDDFTHDDIKLLGYKFEPTIKAPIAV